MTLPDPRLDPTVPHVTETVETVVVRESNTGWWIAGVLGGLVLLAVLWILFMRGADPGTDQALLQAQVDAAEAQADAAAVQGSLAGARAGVEVARADAARAQAEAARAASDARAAEARAATPPAVVVTTPDPAPTAVVTTSTPQN